jgi:methanogenic corrinoid protein MtbC1
MNQVGQRFKEAEIFVPDVMVSVGEMNAGIELLKT